MLILAEDYIDCVDWVSNWANGIPIDEKTKKGRVARGENT
jgi:hypothetical protein